MKKLIALSVLMVFLLAACGHDETIEDDVVEPIVVSFDARGGSPVNPLEWQGDETPPIVPESVREGYAFDGWFMDEGLSSLLEIESLEPGDAIIVYAGWTELIQVSWEVEGETVLEETVRKGEHVTAPAVPDIEGFVFTGWKKGSGEALDAPYVLEESVTLYAVYEPAFYTLTFETDALFSIDPLTQPFGTLLTLEEPEVSGYVFAGWYTDIDFTTPFDAKTMPAKDLTLHARLIDLDAEAFTIDDIRVGRLLEASLKPVQVIYSEAFFDDEIIITFIRDDTATMIVQTSDVFTEGSIVTFDATINFEGDIPFVTSAQNIEDHGVETVDFNYETTTLSALSELDRNDPANWYRVFVVEDALLFQDDLHVGLFDTDSGQSHKVQSCRTSY